MSGTGSAGTRRGATGGAFGVLAGAVCLTAGLLVPQGQTRSAMLALGIVLPGFAVAQMVGAGTIWWLFLRADGAPRAFARTTPGGSSDQAPDRHESLPTRT